MICDSCGATMTRDEESVSSQCFECEQTCSATVASITADGVSPASEVSECLCPSCQIPLQCGFLDEEIVEYCRQCNGILFDQDHFASTVWSRRCHYSSPDAPAQPVDPEELTRQRPCPVCDRFMECHVYYGPGNVAIDSCSECLIVWLDEGELTSIEQAPGERASQNA